MEAGEQKRGQMKDNESLIRQTTSKTKYTRSLPPLLSFDREASIIFTIITKKKNPQIHHLVTKKGGFFLGEEEGGRGEEEEVMKEGRGRGSSCRMIRYDKLFCVLWFLF